MSRPSPAPSARPFDERTLAVACGDTRLVGVLAVPERPAAVGVVVVVGGPQYRAGSHRQFVLLSRHLAGQGIAVLRFDCRGMGDSSGPRRSFEHVGADVRSAIDALVAAVPEVRQVALWGLCDGASAALLYLDEHADRRVQHLCLVNPWVRSDVSLARTHIEHHYIRRVRQPAFWARLFTGRVGSGAVTGLWHNLRLTLSPRRAGAGGAQRPFQHRMADAWRRFPGRILLLLSENDYTAQEFSDALNDDPQWRGAAAHPGLVRHLLAGADHTLSSPEARAVSDALTSAWLLDAAAERAGR